MSDDITPLKPGTEAPPFTLDDLLAGTVIGLDTWPGEALVINFWSAECAWSREYDAYFAERASDWQEQDIRLIHINSNANESADDTLDKAHDLDIETPILDDAGNLVADAYGAITTPHVFLVDKHGVIVYQGAVDDRTFRQKEATHTYLDDAIEAMRRGDSPDPAESPAYGCTIVRDFSS